MWLAATILNQLKPWAYLLYEYAHYLTWNEMILCFTKCRPIWELLSVLSKGGTIQSQGGGEAGVF